MNLRVAQDELVTYWFPTRSAEVDCVSRRFLRLSELEGEWEEELEGRLGRPADAGSPRRGCATRLRVKVPCQDYATDCGRRTTLDVRFGSQRESREENRVAYLQYVPEVTEAPQILVSSKPDAQGVEGGRGWSG